MSTVSYDQAERDWNPDEPAQPLPRRPRRQFFNRKSAALVALITCAAGFYAGVRVEKGQVSASTSTLRLPGATGARSGGFGGFAGGAGAGFAGGNAAVGTVAKVNGRTLVLTETSGNTVNVRLSSSTKISKNQSVSRHAVRPGDTIIVQGAANAKGTTVAASVTDSGASSTGSSSSGSGASSSGASSSGGSSGSANGTTNSNGNGNGGNGDGNGNGSGSGSGSGLGNSGYHNGTGPGAGRFNNPKFRAALTACGATAGFRRGGGNFRPSSAAITKFASCVKQHGYTLPKANLTGTGPVYPVSIERNAKFQAASRSCQSMLRPAGGGAPPSGGAPPGA